MYALQLEPHRVLIGPCLQRNWDAGASRGLDALDDPGCPLVLRPVQSYQILGQTRMETAEGAVFLAARRLPAVIRRWAGLHQTA